MLCRFDLDRKVIAGRVTNYRCKKKKKSIRMQSVNTAEIEIASELLGTQAWNNSWK